MEFSNWYNFKFSSNLYKKTNIQGTYISIYFPDDTNCSYLSIVFHGQLENFKKYFTKKIFKTNEIIEAKKTIDNFIIKMDKLKIFI